MVQTIPAVKTHTLMDLLQQFIHLWAESSFLKNILTDDVTHHDWSPICVFALMGNFRYFANWD